MMKGNIVNPSVLALMVVPQQGRDEIQRQAQTKEVSVPNTQRALIRSIRSGWSGTEYDQTSAGSVHGSDQSPACAPAFNQSSKLGALPLPGQ
jgi:hypothetical protein